MHLLWATGHVYTHTTALILSLLDGIWMDWIDGLCTTLDESCFASSELLLWRAAFIRRVPGLSVCTVSSLIESHSVLLCLVLWCAVFKWWSEMWSGVCFGGLWDACVCSIQKWPIAVCIPLTYHKTCLCHFTEMIVILKLLCVYLCVFVCLCVTRGSSAVRDVEVWGNRPLVVFYSERIEACEKRKFEVVDCQIVTFEMHWATFACVCGFVHLYLSVPIIADTLYRWFCVCVRVCFALPVWVLLVYVCHLHKNIFKLNIILVNTYNLVVVS